MPKKFNKELHEDVNTLKLVYENNDPDDFRTVFNGTLKKHNISRATLYREINKKIPGMYKTFNRKAVRCPVSNRDLKLVSELKEKGKTYNEMREALSLEFGFSYSAQRLKKVLGMLGDLKNKSSNLPAGTPGEHTEAVSTKHGAGQPIEFDGDIRKLFLDIALYDKLDSVDHIEINLKGKLCKVSSPLVKNCLKRMAISAGHGGKSVPEIIKFNVEQVLLQESENYKNGMYIAPVGVRQLVLACRTLEAAAEAAKKRPRGGYDMDAVYAAVAKFSPRTPRDAVARFLKKYIEGDSAPATEAE